MNGSEGPAEGSEEPLEAAAAWWYRGQVDAAVNNSPEFLAWMADAEHVRAYQAVQYSMAALRDFGATPRILDMRRAALAQLHGSDRKRRIPWRPLLQAAAAIFVVAVAGTAFFL